MDSLGIMLNRLRLNSEDFKERFINITSVYNAPFDSDTILRYLADRTLREEQEDDWVVEIPMITFDPKNNEYVMPSTVTLNPDIIIPMPETIEEFRSMAKAHGIQIKLNTKTATFLYA